MFNNKKAEFLIAALLILSSVSCAEDVLLPGEERGVWMLVPPLRETIGSDIRATAEGPDGELYVATRRAVSGDGTGLVLLTDDAGLTWDIGGKGMNPDRRIFEFEILEDGTAFAGMERGGVFRSCDRGMTWKQVNNHLPDLELRSIVTIPDGRLLVSTYFNGLFLSSDRGDRWERCLADSVLNSGMILETDHVRNIVYASPRYAREVFYSDDNCATWTTLPILPGEYSHYTSDLLVDGESTLYLFARDILLKYPVNEGEWVDITPEHDGLNMSHFMLGEDGSLYMVLWEGRVLWSGDGGGSWQVKDWNTAGMYLLMIFSNRNCLFLVDGNYSSFLCRSCDEGISWQSAGRLDVHIQDLLVDSSGGMIGFTGIRLHRRGEADDMWTYIWTYMDGGCWQDSHPNSVLTGLCPDGDILVSYCGLTRIPGEGGPGYRMMGEDTLVISIEIDPAGMIFLATDNGVMRSMDYGDSWETILPELTNVLELEANADSTVYIATENGLLISEDYGSTWETLIDSTVVNSITSDSDGSIYAGVEGGIMFSADRGRNWEMIRFEGYLETPRTLEMSSGGRVVALTNYRRLYLIEKGCADHRVIFSELPSGISILIGEDGYLYYFVSQIFRYSVPVDML